MNHISRDNRKISYAHTDSPVYFMDYFVDGRSFESYLRETFQGIFSLGRYRETQVPTLSGNLEDVSLRAAVADNILPPNNESRTCLIYCCHDGCCAYGYVDVYRRDEVVVWERFGLNAAFAGILEGAEEGITWLSGFQPLYFAFDEYCAMISAFRE